MNFFSVLLSVLAPKVRIHQGPDIAVEFDDAVQPTGVGGVDADPGVIGILRVTDLQSGRDPLASEHARHNGGIVQTDTGAGIQNGIYVGSIAGGGIGSLIVVVGNISGDIIIDPGDHLPDRRMHLPPVPAPWQRLCCLT